MPLPDKHANEPTVEIQASLFQEMMEAKTSVEAWTKRYNELKAEMTALIGDAYAATLDGVKVLTYRPKATYAESRLRQDFPDLTQHFVELKAQDVFNMDKFREAHPDIAEKYRIRALVEVKTT